mmetsp:Transcript_2408/g.2665  ORF Transcript_2408/g.2665 Transcript_2408/m.2665 type:complete len:213 (-) Transcript_2408:998-1636(-)
MLYIDIPVVVFSIILVPTIFAVAIATGRDVVFVVIGIVIDGCVVVVFVVNGIVIVGFTIFFVVFVVVVVLLLFSFAGGGGGGGNDDDDDDKFGSVVVATVASAAAIGTDGIAVFVLVFVFVLQVGMVISVIAVLMVPTNFVTVAVGIVQDSPPVSVFASASTSVPGTGSNDEDVDGVVRFGIWCGGGSFFFFFFVVLAVIIISVTAIPIVAS